MINRNRKKKPAAAATGEDGCYVVAFVYDAIFPLQTDVQSDLRSNPQSASKCVYVRLVGYIFYPSVSCERKVVEYICAFDARNMFIITAAMTIKLFGESQLWFKCVRTTSRLLCVLLWNEKLFRIFLFCFALLCYLIVSFRREFN